jgi:4-amino-4-deoxy-L-arabinose transferase-like glycosyltransferase
MKKMGEPFVKVYVFLADRRNWQLICLGLLVALVLRLGVSFILPPDFLYNAAGDSVLYRNLATNLLETGVFGSDPGIPTVRVPPIYPYVLAGIYALFGRNVVYVQRVQALLGTLSCGLVYLLTDQIFTDRRVTWLSFATVIFHPVLIF